MTVNPAKIAEPMNMQSYRIEWAQETIPHKWIGNFQSEKGLTDGIPGYVQWSICSKLLNRGHHQYSADTNLGVLDGVTLAQPGGNATVCQISLTACYGRPIG